MNREEFIAHWFLARRASLEERSIQEINWSYWIKEANRAWKAYQEALTMGQKLEN